MQSSYDIIIVGSGIVGLTLALALAQQTRLSIALIEAKSADFSWDSTHYHSRVSAITLSSQQLFSRLNCWQDMLKKRVSAFQQIDVRDTHHNRLQFSSCDIGQPQLGFVIENNVMQSVLFEHVKQYAQVHVHEHTRLKTLQQDKQHQLLITEDAHTFKSQLIIAADGAQSWIRQQLSISTKRFDYDEKGIVATVQTALAHKNIARQIFLPTGPLAFLPLKTADFSSIVWTLPKDIADDHLSLSDEKFMHILADAFQHQLGDIIAIDKRFAFPLVRQKSTQYVLPGIALAGDAAHTIHPLAGLGVNIGLLDAANLVTVITEAIHARRDFSHLSTLRKYERARRAENAVFFTGIDFIKSLFASEKKITQTALSVGLTMTNQLSWLKNFFMRYATGV